MVGAVVGAASLGVFRSDGSALWTWAAVGREITSSGIPRVDTLSHASFQDPWIVLAWAGKVFVGALLRQSAAVLVATQVGLAVLSVLLLLWIWRRQPLWAGPAALCAVLVARPGTELGVQLVVWPLSVLLVAIVGSRIRTPWLVLCCAGLMAAWANLHPGFVVGATALAAAGVGRLLSGFFGEERKRPDWSLLLGAAAGWLAVLANPYGYHSLALALSRVPPGGQAALRQALAGMGFHETAYWPLLAACAGVGIVLALVPGPRRWRHLHMLFLAPAALFTPNAIVPFGAAFGYLLIDWLGEESEARALRFGAAAPLAAVLAAAACVLLLGPGIMAADSLAGLDQLPASAVAFVEANPPPGEIYHPAKWGGYLAWRLGPERKILIDERPGVNLRRATSEYPLVDAGLAVNWGYYFEDYGISYALVPAESTLARVLDAASTMALVYSDETASVFVRSDYLESGVYSPRGRGQ